MHWENLRAWASACCTCAADGLGISDWQACWAAWKVGLLGLRSLFGPLALIPRLPCELGSGKSLTPCERMQAEKARALPEPDDPDDEVPGLGLLEPRLATPGPELPQAATASARPSATAASGPALRRAVHGRLRRRSAGLMSLSMSISLSPTSVARPFLQMKGFKKVSSSATHVFAADS